MLDVPALAEQPLRGYLTGSIDAVLRLPGATALRGGRLQDQLARRAGRAADRRDYTPTRWRGDGDAHYPLQALLYSVALHRSCAGGSPATTRSAISAA